MSSGLPWFSFSVAMIGGWPTAYRVDSKSPEGIGKKSEMALDQTPIA